ncbi:MAG: hypothetical protein J6V24_12670, partial [Clostridia bacterium]|nr:hypothetical protein [Clostridia bacterium]
MKKLFLFTLAALLLLTSCSRRTEEVVYYNRPDGCQIGETIILNAPSHADNVYNAGFERAAGLCRDPLCQHDGRNGPCPESATFGLPRSFCTDGETLFMKVYALEREHPMLYRIYAVNPFGVEPMRLICTTENTGNFAPFQIYADGEYLYYTNCHYREGADRGAEFMSTDDQYLEIMRIRKNGGKSERVFDMLPVGTVFAVDSERYYLFHGGEGMDGACEIIPKDGGERITVSADGVRLRSLLFSENGHIVLLGAEEPVSATVTETRYFDRMALVEIRGGRAEVVAEHVNAYSPIFPYDGKLWFAPFYIEFLETAAAPTGRGNETVMTDIYALSDNTLCSLDPETGETRRFQYEGDGMLIGFSDGIAIGRSGTSDH